MLQILYNKYKYTLNWKQVLLSIKYIYIFIYNIFIYNYLNLYMWEVCAAFDIVKSQNRVK